MSTAADFFCGGGGAGTGLKQAGFNVLLAIDNWRPACRTYKLNHKRAMVHLGDMTKATTFDLLEKYKGTIDFLWQSPPCVDYSTANTVNKDEIQAAILWHASIEALKIIKPKFYVIENVPQILNYVKLPAEANAWLLNAADYGVPQTRRRVFITNLPKPQPTHHVEEMATLDGKYLPKWIGVKQALGITGMLMKDGDTSANMKAARFKSVEEPSRTILASHTAKVLDTDETPEELYQEWLDDRPSYTIMASEWKGTWKEPRRASRLIGRKLTIQERMILQGFPKDYILLGKSQAILSKLVGNAVPPPMSKAFGELAMQMIVR
jgi:DNA (cytosine-5)-methyltransferase 1